MIWIREKLNAKTYSALSISIEPSYFDKKHGHALSKFDYHCKPVLDSFARKWHPSTARAEYLTTFSFANWEALPKSAKSKHCLTDCRECTKQFLALQQSFPARKKQVPRATKQAESACTGFLESTLPANVSESEATQSLVEGMDRAYQDAFGHSFLESVLQHLPDKQVQKKRSPVETKHQWRKIIQKNVQHIEKQLQSRDATTIFEEGLSLKGYNRIRLSESHETPKQKVERVAKHPPNKKHILLPHEIMTWDTDAVVNELKNSPHDKKVNWTELARKHSVPGMNGGQVIKEYAQKCGIDTISLDHRQPGKVLRAKKLKIPGKDISFPCHKTVRQVKEEWAKLIQQWVYSIGEQCAPKEVTTVTAKGGHIVKQQTTMYSRRIRLKEM